MTPHAPNAVFIVDDDEAFRTSMRRLLRAAGYDPHTFGTVDELLDHGLPASGCLLLDVHMPGRGGFDVVGAMQAHHARLPFIFVTAEEDPAVVERARRAGAVAFLNKPVPADDLLAAVRRAFATA